jgi:hypothetical protein
MTLPSLARPAALAVGLALLLGACSAATADQGAPRPTGGPAAGPQFPEGPGPDDRPDPALAGEPVPTLPPGDPGTGSGADTTGDAGGPDGADGAEAGEHEENGHEAEPPAVTSVPDSALVDAETVGALAGGSWRAGGSAEPCPVVPPADATATRTATLASSGGRLTQSVSAHRSVGAAKDAVAVIADRLAGCGFTPDGDPRLGEASARLVRDGTEGRELALVLAVEGATVVLLGGGSAAAPGAWMSLADVALGNACTAGVHGCH